MKDDKLKLTEELTKKIGALLKRLETSIELHEEVLDQIRQRDRDINYLGKGLRRSEVNEDGDTEIVSYHHNAGRLVLATVPEWTEGMDKHVLHAQDDIERLLAENARLRMLIDLKDAIALRSSLKKDRS